jgi:transposase
LPHLTIGRRGPAPKLSLHALFNYILKLLYLGCQWKELPIAKDAEGRPEIHYTRIYGAFRRWQAGGCFDIIFTVVVLKLHQSSLLDVTIIHGDGTTTAAKRAATTSVSTDTRGSKAIKSWPSVTAIAMSSRRLSRLLGTTVNRHSCGRRCQV